LPNFDLRSKHAVYDWGERSKIKYILYKYNIYFIFDAFSLSPPPERSTPPPPYDDVRGGGIQEERRKLELTLKRGCFAGNNNIYIFIYIIPFLIKQAVKYLK